MQEFCATRIEHDGEYSEIFWARDKHHAEEVCKKLDWIYDGQLMLIVPCSEMTLEQANSLLARMNHHETSV